MFGGIDLDYLVGATMGNGGQVLTGQKSLEDGIKDEAMKQLTANMPIPGLDSAPTDVAANAPDFSVPIEDTLSLNKAIPNNHSIGNAGNINIPENTSAITSTDDIYNGLTTSAANVTEEAPGTFMGLEGKDYAKMGVGAGLNAAVGMAMQPPTPQKPTPPPTPNRPGAYQAPQQSQGMAQTLAVNSNQNPNGFKPMTQAEGLLNPFQADMYRRRGY